MENRVLGLLVRPQMRADSGSEDSESEGLGDVIVGAGLQSANGVSVLSRSRQHDDRRADAILPKLLAGVPTVTIRQIDIEKDQVRKAGPGSSQPLRNGGRRRDREVRFLNELFCEGLANVFRWRHCVGPLGETAWTARPGR